MNMIRTTAAKATVILSLMALSASPAAAQGLNAADLSFAFNNNGKSMQVAKPELIASARGMTQTEMQETEGAFLVPGAIVGGVGGGLAYGFSCVQTRNCTLGGAAFSVGSGAVLGFAGGPTTLARFAFIRHGSIFSGVAHGQGARRGWW